MRFPWRLAASPNCATSKAFFTSTPSLRARKFLDPEKKTVSSSKRSGTKPQAPPIDLLRSQRLPKRPPTGPTESASTGQDHQGWQKWGRLAGVFFRPYRRYFIWWVAGTGACYLYFVVAYGRTRETVPVSGRRRCKGSVQFNKQYERGLQNAQILLPKDKVYLLHQTEEALLAERVHGVLKRVAFVTGLEGQAWRVHIIDGPPQAAMTPFGDIFITPRLLHDCATDAQLAHVIAHEVAHFLADHSRKSSKINKLYAATLLPLLPLIVPGVAMCGVGMMGGMMLAEELFLLLVPGILLTSPAPLGEAYRLYKSREREYEADKIGVFLATAAGYDAGAGLDILRKLGDFEKRMLAVVRRLHPNARVMSENMTHPPIGSRIDRLRRLIPIARTAVQQYESQGTPGRQSGVGLRTNILARRWADFARRRDERRAGSVEQSG